MTLKAKKTFNPNLTRLANAMINDMKQSFAKHVSREDSREYLVASRMQLMNWYILTVVLNGMDKEHMLAELRRAADHAETFLPKSTPTAH
jgi:hypothetical protein